MVAVAHASGPDGRSLRGAGDVKRRVRLLHRPWAHDHRHAAELERLPGPCLLEDPDGLFEYRHAAALVHSEQRILLKSVADPEREGRPSAADDVEDGDVLSQTDRMVQHGDEGREVHHDALGAAGDG